MNRWRDRLRWSTRGARPKAPFDGHGRFNLSSESIGVRIIANSLVSRIFDRVTFFSKNDLAGCVSDSRSFCSVVLEWRHG
jgi:hypothetical protein